MLICWSVNLLACWCVDVKLNSERSLILLGFQDRVCSVFYSHHTIAHLGSENDNMTFRFFTFTNCSQELLLYNKEHNVFQYVDDSSFE